MTCRSDFNNLTSLVILNYNVNLLCSFLVVVLMLGGWSVGVDDRALLPKFGSFLSLNANYCRKKTKTVKTQTVFRENTLACLRFFLVSAI